MMLLFGLSFAASMLGGFVLPWWWPAVVGAALGFWKPDVRFKAFRAAFLGTALAWGIVSSFFQIGNHGLLAGRVAVIFNLPNGWCVAGITALLGGLTAGLGAWLGRYVRITPPR